MSTSKLETAFRLGRHGDDVYAALIEAHEGLSDLDSSRLNARLVLILANQLADGDAVVEAIRHARSGLDTANLRVGKAQTPAAVNPRPPSPKAS